MRLVFGRKHWWLAAAAVVAVSAALVVPTLVYSYSVDDQSFYDGASDMSAFDASQTVGIVADSQGGLRLQTDGATQTSTWTTKSDFEGTGATGPLEGLLTADATATGSLRLRYLPLAMDGDANNPIMQSALSSTTPADGFEVHGPSVIKVSANEYRMYYTGVAADGYVQRVFEATSTNGTAWSKVMGDGFGGCVLDVGEPGSFDEYGIVRPTVTYNASSTVPYRMWYGGLARSAGYIGYATSADGEHWVKWVATSGEASGTPAPVVSPGVFGSADGYGVGEPSVAYDPATGQYHMYYVASPSSAVKGRAVGHATSSETTANGFGAVWSKGGLVTISGGAGKYTGGWFSPGAFMDTTQKPADGKFWMIFAGKQSAGQAYKLMTAKSQDANTWNMASNLLFANNAAWNSNNVFWACMLPDPVGSALYRIYYTGSGGTGDRARDSIGYATVSNSLGNATPISKALSASDPGPRFDTNQSAQGTVWQNPNTGQLNMFYAGRSTRDLIWRIGLATSTVDATSWAAVDGTADTNAKSVLALGNAAAFDASGTLSASVISLDPSATSVAMAYEGVSAAGVSGIGIATTAGNNLVNWTRPTGPAFAAGGAGAFDTQGVGHPSLVKTPTGLRIYYAGYNGTAWQIGVATSTAITGPWNKFASAVVTLGAPGTFSAVGAYDPVVAYDASASVPYRMWYTAEDAGPDGLSTTAEDKIDNVRRIAFATSVDGLNWTQAGLAVIPSGDPWAFDEMGVRAGGVWRDNAGTWHLYYDGIDRGSVGNSAENPAVQWRRIAHASGRDAGYVNNGGGTYQLTPTMTVDAVTPYKYDFRDFTWDATTPAGTSMNLEMSFYPGYQMINGQWAPEWSPWAPVDGDVKPSVPLTTEKIRWRVSLMRESGATTVTPTLDEFRVIWAPTHFRPSGQAISTTITPTAGKYVESWTNLNVVGIIAQNTSATATILDMQGRTLLGPTQITGTNDISLSVIDPSVQQIRVRFDFIGNGRDTPKVKNWKVTYVSTNRAPVEVFQAFGKNQGVTLTWIEPTYDGLSDVRILRNTTGFPSSPTDVTSKIVYEASATAGVYRSVDDTETLTNTTLYYYTAYTRDNTGKWSPPAKSFAIPGPTVDYLKAASGSAITLKWKYSGSIAAPFKGVTIAKRETTAPLGPDLTSSMIVGRDFPSPAGIEQTKIDTTVTPGAKTYYAAYVHNQLTINSTIYDGYSMPATAVATPLWPTAARFDARGIYSGGYYRAYVSGWVPSSLPATCTVRIYVNYYSRITTMTGMSTKKIYDRVLSRGQEITYTSGPLKALTPIWYTVFLTAPTSDGITMTSPPAYAAALPRSTRVGGFKVVPGDKRNTAYWSKPTYFYKIYTTPSAAVSAKAKYYCSGVRVVRRQGAKVYDVTDPAAKALTSGAAYSTTVSVADLSLTNLQLYWYRAYLGVKIYDKYGYDYDFGTPSSDVYAVPKYTSTVSATMSGYNKIVSPYYYYAYGRYMTVGGAVAPNHYTTSTGARGYVRVYVYLRKYNSITRRYYWAVVKNQVVYLSSTSTYKYSYRFARGYYMVKTSFGGDGDHLPRNSTVRYARVY